MNKEKFRELFKKLRDLMSCCKKTIDVVDDVFEDIEDLQQSDNPFHESNANIVPENSSQQKH